MRTIQQPITVQTTPNGAPDRLHWHGRDWRLTRTIDTWRAAGRWWHGEPPRDYWLAEYGHLTAEIYREDAPEGRWVLARIMD